LGRLFGTDGVRGLANADLSPELAMAISVAAVRTLVAADSSHQPLALVGRDPRASGEMLEAAVVAGLASAGANVVRVGVLPTPGVAFLTAEVNADLGVMISASHNPMPDNGIKLFAAGGHKLPDEVEDSIERLLKDDGVWIRPVGAQVGRIHDLVDGAEHYVAHLLAAASHPLDGLRVVLDCANGAASDIGPEAFSQAGAEVIAIHADPDGLNINDGCGSTHLASLKAAVSEHAADLGFAFDGDADRCLAVDGDGSEVDGDQLMAILALSMKDAGSLTENTLVATVMSNLGLKIAMREAGIELIEAKVGDRYVLEELRARGLALGGEQSGHLIVPSHATTGDGVLSGLLVAARVAATGKSLATLAGVVRKLPQVLVNVRVGDKGVTRAPAVAAAVATAEEVLSGAGRVLLRPSGTEPLVRVMVEASTHDAAQKIADELAATVRAASPVAFS
jgi:phosphoglucosamine mutase